MTPASALKLGLKVCFTKIRVRKIDGSTFEIFGIVLASVQVENYFEKARFFQKTFLVADTGAKIILECFA